MVWGQSQSSRTRTLSKDGKFLCKFLCFVNSNNSKPVLYFSFIIHYRVYPNTCHLSEMKTIHALSPQMCSLWGHPVHAYYTCLLAFENNSSVSFDDTQDWEQRLAMKICFRYWSQWGHDFTMVLFPRWWRLSRLHINQSHYGWLYLDKIDRKDIKMWSVNALAS